jgi:hypothetical protein
MSELHAGRLIWKWKHCLRTRFLNARCSLFKLDKSLLLDIGVAKSSQGTLGFKTSIKESYEFRVAPKER